MSPKQNAPGPSSTPELKSLQKQVNRLQKTLFVVCFLLFGGVISYLFIFSGKPVETPGPEPQKTSVPASKNMPQEIGLPAYAPETEFAGEKVPYAADFEVRERIDREVLGNTFSHSRTLLVIKRAGRWFPVITRILKENGVPDDLKYVAVIESDLSNVISPAGATGFWQFMKATAPEFGLEVGEEVDERYDVEKSTVAACAYFKKAYARFNSWTLSAASYNMGMEGVSKRLQEQGQTSYYDLDLSAETTRYVARILAMKSIFQNPAAYGFHIGNADLYPPIPVRVAVVDGPVADWAVWAKENGTSLKMLRELNPWLRKNKLTNAKGKRYEVKLPVADFNYAEAQRQIRGVLPE